MQNCWIVSQHCLPIFPSDMYIRMLWVILCHRPATLCYLNSKVQFTQDVVQKSPHFYNRRQHKHKDTMKGHVNTLLQMSEQCTDNGKHHLQLAAAQVPLQFAPLSCSDIELTACILYSPAWFTFLIKNTGSSSRKKINNVASAGIIQRWKSGSWQCYEDFSTFFCCR